MRDERGRGNEIKQLLYIDYSLLMAYSLEDLYHIVSEFGRTCDKMKVKINVDKNKVVVVMKDKRTSKENANVNMYGKEKVVRFKYLGVIMDRNGSMGKEVTYRLHEGRKIVCRKRNVNCRIQRKSASACDNS